MSDELIDVTLMTDVSKRWYDPSTGKTFGGGSSSYGTATIYSSATVTEPSFWEDWAADEIIDFFASQLAEKRR